MLQLRTLLATTLFALLLLTSCEKEILLDSVENDIQQYEYLESQDQNLNDSNSTDEFSNTNSDKNSNYDQNNLKTIPEPPSCIIDILNTNNPQYYILYGLNHKNTLYLEAIQHNSDVISFDWTINVFSEDFSPKIFTYNKPEQLELNFGNVWYSDISLTVNFSNGITQVTNFRAIIDGPTVTIENSNISDELPYINCSDYCTTCAGSTFTCILP